MALQPLPGLGLPQKLPPFIQSFTGYYNYQSYACFMVTALMLIFIKYTVWFRNYFQRVILNCCTTSCCIHPQLVTLYKPDFFSVKIIMELVPFLWSSIVISPPCFVFIPKPHTHACVWAQSLNQMVFRACCWVLTGHEVNPWLSSSASAKNGWNYTSIPPYASIACIGE